MAKEVICALAGVPQWIECQPAYKPEGRWFNSQSGHMPGLWARSPGWGTKRQPHIDVSFPPLLFKNK